jgi:hypothetical protein
MGIDISNIVAECFEIYVFVLIATLLMQYIGLNFLLKYNETKCQQYK